MLLWRESIPDDWLPKVRANLDAVLVDHCHLERKAATSALNLMKYPELAGRARELNAIAQEELAHFNCCWICWSNATCPSACRILARGLVVSCKTFARAGAGR